MQTTLDKFGRLTLPKALRLHLGIDSHTLLDLREQGDTLVIRVVRTQPPIALENGLLVYTGEAIGDFDNVLDTLRQERLKDL